MFLHVVEASCAFGAPNTIYVCFLQVTIIFPPYNFMKQPDYLVYMLIETPIRLQNSFLVLLPRCEA